MFLLASGKSGTDDLFDKLDTSKLNAHLKDLMPGLTAKVFRTYNASITLDDMVNILGASVFHLSIICCGGLVNSMFVVIFEGKQSYPFQNNSSRMFDS